MRCGVNRSVVYDRFWHESESLGAAKNFGGCPGVEETYLARGTQARVWPNSHIRRDGADEPSWKTVGSTAAAWYTLIA